MVGNRFVRRAARGMLLVASAGLLLAFAAEPLLRQQVRGEQPQGPAAQAQAGPGAAVGPAKPPVGFLIRVPVPIDEKVDSRVRAAVSHLIGKLPAGGPRPVVIFEFNPGQTEGGKGSQFGGAFSLAKFISTDPALHGVKTVAYIPKTIKGHAVLVAMACEQIIMAPDADIGEAGIDETAVGADGVPRPEIGPTIRSGYKEIADVSKSIPAPIALGMLDKDLTVFKVTTEQGTEFVLQTDLDELTKHHTVTQRTELSPRPGLYTGLQARHDLGFASYLADDRQGVARALDLPAEAVIGDPSLEEGVWRPVQVPIRTVISQSLVTETKRKIEDQVVNSGVNFVCVWIESAGGSPTDSIALASYLASLNSRGVRTVAYIPARARGDAALIAAGCDQIVMGPTAMIGGSGDYQMNPDEIERIRDERGPFRSENSPLHGVRNWSLPLALVDPNLKVFRYTQPNSGLKECLSEDEAKEKQVDAAGWIKGEPISSEAGHPLRLSGDQAEELGLARTAGDFNEFKRLYGLEHDVALVEPGWADFLISALSSPGMKGFLWVLGILGIMAEVWAPGHGIGGFVGLVAFMLFFWIEHLHGTAGWLEVLLFLAGVGCVLLEIFVLPGFAIFGLGGGLMIITSLVLASQTFILPRNDYQVEQLTGTLVTLSGAVLGSIALAVIFRRYLPHAPGLNRIFLNPPSLAEKETIASREALVDFSNLLGRIGATTTPLMPSGKARFADRLVDVMADGEFIDRGVEVEAIEVRGNRVLVRAAKT